MKQVILFFVGLVLSTAVFGQNDPNDSTRTFGQKLSGIFEADSSQVVKNLTITDAEVLVKDKPVRKAEVVVYKQNSPVDTTYTNEEGQFSLALEFDSIYVLEFSKPGYVTKKLEVDATGMPAEDKAGGYDLGRFQLSLFRTTANMDLSVYETPIARYYYDDRMRQFQVDRKHLKKKQKEIEKVKEANEELLAQKEADKEKRQEEFDLLIRDADIEYDAGNYEYSKELYKEALEIFNEASYPRQRIIQINEKLKRELNKEEKYDILIAQADESMNLENYASAKADYLNALKIFPNKSYPKTKLGEIEELQKNPKSEELSKKDYSLENIDISPDNSSFAAALASKYPQGLTVETIKEDDKTIEKRIIIDGNTGVEYQKVTHNWGGQYYFKNKASITQFVYQTEAYQLND